VTSWANLTTPSHDLTSTEPNDKLLIMNKKKTQLFDEWPEAYDRWFTTPIGSLVKKYETELILDLLSPKQGEVIMDAGCGTGVFTFDILSLGSKVIGLDISLPMLVHAGKKLREFPFQKVLADILNLPFQEDYFDKILSITALEFIENARGAVEELFRVTKRGGSIVVATMNGLSPWAERRRTKAKKGHHLFEKAIFRSPDELLQLSPFKGVVKTAIHFQREDDPERAMIIEHEGQKKNLKTGALVAVCWKKP
jgi:ubiquinone/menaquinone biosynthesis C-methylase UbiE